MKKNTHPKLEFPTSLNLKIFISNFQSSLFHADPNILQYSLAGIQMSYRCSVHRYTVACTCTQSNCRSTPHYCRIVLCSIPFVCEKSASAIQHTRHHKHHSVRRFRYKEINSPLLFPKKKLIIWFIALSRRMNCAFLYWKYSYSRISIRFYANLDYYFIIRLIYCIVVCKKNFRNFFTFESIGIKGKKYI